MVRIRTRVKNQISNSSDKWWQGTCVRCVTAKWQWQYIMRVIVTLWQRMMCMHVMACDSQVTMAACNDSNSDTMAAYVVYACRGVWQWQCIMTVIVTLWQHMMCMHVVVCDSQVTVTVYNDSNSDTVTACDALACHGVWQPSDSDSV